MAIARFLMCSTHTEPEGRAQGPELRVLVTVTESDLLRESVLLSLQLDPGSDGVW